MSDHTFFRDLERKRIETGMVSDEHGYEFQEWVGVDLDGTLAIYDGWKSVDDIGAPVLPIVRLVRAILASGMKVKVFTARAVNPDAIDPIRAWLWENGLPDLEVTNVKDYGMVALIDDRAIQVERNTGRILGNPSLVPAMDIP